jgi:hypothetical protein
MTQSCDLSYWLYIISCPNKEDADFVCESPAILLEFPQKGRTLVVQHNINL